MIARSKRKAGHVQRTDEVVGEDSGRRAEPGAERSGGSRKRKAGLVVGEVDLTVDDQLVEDGGEVD